jgi:hypothetical protein
MADTDYDGIFGTGFSFTFTPTTGTPFGSAQAQVEEANTPPVTIDTAKYTPISGSNSGKEQFAMGRFPVQEYKIKVTYSAASHAAALTCLNAKVKGTLACTYGDGSTESYAGSGLTSVSAGPNTASGLRTAEVTFTCPVAPTFSAGTTIKVVQTTQALTAGAATIDLTASPFSGGTLTPIRAFFMNPAGSTYPITLAIGASNGYDGFGDDFSVEIAAGDSIQLEGHAALSGSKKTIDVSSDTRGTDELVVQIQLQ